MDIKPILDALRPIKLADVDAVVIPSDHKLVSIQGYLDALASKAGHVAINTLTGLVAYLERFKTSESAVFASEKLGNIVAILDWHPVHEMRGGMARHSAVLALEATPQWKAWNAIDKKAINQAAFAEFIEENLGDVVSPSSAELLEVVTTLSGKKNVEFKQAVRLQSGAVGVQWEETIAAKAGESGQLNVPSEIVIEIPVYRGCEEATTYRIRCLLRYRIENNRLSFEVRMQGIERIHTIAFNAVFDSLGELCKAEKIAVPIYNGSVTTTPLAAVQQ